MAQYRPVIRQFSGLNTKGLEDGRRGGEFVLLQNARLREGAIKRRLGMVRLDVAAAEAQALDFDGIADYVTVAIDTRVWALGTKFTIRVLANADVNNGTRPLFKAGVTTPSVEVTTSANKVVLNVWDSAATQTTITSTEDMPTGRFSLFITRDGATLSMVLDGDAVTSTDTDTMDADLSLRTPAGALEIARDGASAFFDGKIDHLDVFGCVLPTNRDRLLRWPDPFAMPACLASYDFNANANSIVKDLSRFRNHGRVQGSPSEVSALGHNAAPVRAIFPYRNRSGQRRAYVEAQGLPYCVEL